MSDEAVPGDHDTSKNAGVYTNPIREHYHGEIWHFTDSAALVSMVKNRRLWASAAPMLNDPRELVYGAKRIIWWYETHGKELLPKNAELHMQLTEILHTFKAHVTAVPAYVVCASTSYRVLNQWRNYASTQGVAVRLEPHADLIPVDPPMREEGFMFQPEWVEVLYDPKRQDARIESTLQGLTKGDIAPVLKSSKKAANELIRGVLSVLAASMKDSAYAEEREVRLITLPFDGIELQHRGAARGVIPYIEITHYENFGWEHAGLQGIGKPDASLPIMEVRVGPPAGQSERQRVYGVKSLLRSNGLNAPVNGSTIKFLP